MPPFALPRRRTTSHPPLITLIWAAMCEYRRLRRDARALQTLPDYLLKDLGLTRDGRRR
ncbi:DUF1127 domain-containing protein [Pseudooceanicola sp. MF1-13]|uniref:DUF1127 domain-containing protein n=1 Tax=Pseudooceanicola sp. MF1-13 TaxID=3379095 RepID=UPI0038922A1E